MANLIRRDPFRGAVSLRDAIDGLFDESFLSPFAEWSLLRGERQAFALDVYETDEALVVEASLPGFSPEQIDVSVVGSTLSIKGEVKKDEEREEKGRYHYRERSISSFERAIALPAEVDAGQAEAGFENGVLKLTLPKVEEAKPKRIEVKVQ